VNDSLKKRSWTVILCVFTLLALTIGGVYAISEESQEGSPLVDSECGRFFPMRMWGRQHGGMLGGLSDEQRNELRSEIHDLIISRFEEWDIEPPEPLLSQEQRKELRSEVEGLRYEGVSREDVMDFVQGKLEE
jgi:hypothetical protein